MRHYGRANRVEIERDVLKKSYNIIDKVLNLCNDSLLFSSYVFSTWVYYSGDIFSQVGRAAFQTPAPVSINYDMRYAVSNYDMRFRITICGFELCYAVSNYDMRFRITLCSFELCSRFRIMICSFEL